MPLVSVIIPFFNGSAFIQRAVDSVRRQTSSDLELLLVDDGSRQEEYDSLRSLISHAGPAARILTHPDRRNLGIGSTRALGIRAATGTYVAFLDQDDVWVPQKLELQLEAFERCPNATFVYGRIGFIDAHGAATSDAGHVGAGKGRAGGSHWILRQLLVENIVPSITVLARTDHLMPFSRLSGGPAFQYEDWLLWTLLAAKGRAVFLDAVLAYRRLHGDNYSFARMKNRNDILADRHYVTTVFPELAKQFSSRPRWFRAALRRRLVLFFIRARSWGASREELQQHADMLLQSFPAEYGWIRFGALLGRAMSPAPLSWLRWLRRTLVGT